MLFFTKSLYFLYLEKLSECIRFGTSTVQLFQINYPNYFFSKYNAEIRPAKNYHLKDLLKSFQPILQLEIFRCGQNFLASGFSFSVDLNSRKTKLKKNI